MTGSVVCFSQWEDTNWRGRKILLPTCFKGSEAWRGWPRTNLLSLPPLPHSPPTSPVQHHPHPHPPTPPTAPPSLCSVEQTECIRIQLKAVKRSAQACSDRPAREEGCPSLYSCMRTSACERACLPANRCAFPLESLSQCTESVAGRRAVSFNHRSWFVLSYWHTTTHLGRPCCVCVRVFQWEEQLIIKSLLHYCSCNWGLSCCRLHTQATDYSP